MFTASVVAETRKKLPIASYDSIADDPCVQPVCPRPYPSLASPVHGEDDRSHLGAGLGDFRCYAEPDCVVSRRPTNTDRGLLTRSCYHIGVDARFPNTNQTKHCWQNYVDYHKCILAKGEEFAPCRQVGSAKSPAITTGPL